MRASCCPYRSTEGWNNHVQSEQMEPFRQLGVRMEGEAEDTVGAGLGGERGMQPVPAGGALLGSREPLPDRLPGQPDLHPARRGGVPGRRAPRLDKRESDPPGRRHVRRGDAGIRPQGHRPDPPRIRREERCGDGPDGPLEEQVRMLPVRRRLCRLGARLRSFGPEEVSGRLRGPRGMDALRIRLPVRSGAPGHGCQAEAGVQAQRLPPGGIR